MLAPFIAGTAVGFGLTLAALFLWVITFGEPVDLGGSADLYPADNPRDEGADAETPSPIRRRSPVGATPKGLVDPISHEGTMRDV